MASFVKFNAFAGNIGLGLINLDTDVLKVALTNSAPVAATDDELADITQIANGNGYTTGGSTSTNNVYAQTSGVGKLVSDDVVFTASGGTMGPFRYAVLYSDTSTGDKLIGYWDRGDSITLQNGEPFTVDFNGTTGVLTIT